MRGAMNFEDYNYDSINRHVLINPYGSQQQFWGDDEESLTTQKLT